MKIVPITRTPNEDAVTMLKGVISRIESGEISSVGVSWVTSSDSIGGDISDGENHLMMWASLEHTARCFYDQRIKGDT